MPTPGKPVLSPFSTATKPINGELARQGIAKPDTPAASKPKHLKGISQIGTTDRLKQLDMAKATGLSAALHLLTPLVLTVLALLVVLLLSWLLHFNFWDIFKPKAPPKDMEFTLVKDTNASPPEKALFKGNFNQKAGGKRDPNQPLKAIDQEPQSSPAKQASPPQKTQEAKQAQTPTEPQAKPTPPKPQPEKPTQKPDFVPTIPTGKKAEPTESSKNEPAKEAQAGAQGSQSQLASIGQQASGAGNGITATGNAQGGESKDSGVDVAQDPDFGPFMADLERRIKRNWIPPRGAESRKVVLLFYLARDGKVVKIETRKSSGDKEADEAAAQAIDKSAPFMAFPPQVQEDILPVEFTFDYNVLNPKNSKQALKR